MQVAKNQAAKYCILNNDPQKLFKKNQKTLKKGIDKRKEMWYNSQAVREEAGSETVIENWTTREKYKALRSAKILDLVKELYILNKVKEAKN